ncbi:MULTISPECIES: hypothetical protein [unclassified Lentimicrobium]|uniref:hypothetical protein n=1 Tax=unclassified Lentimicrobium TaxID=2677434 RepID=UPI00155645A9|nr:MULTISPECIES: hypothetical protein [unclassified Lentimicrobium]NPD47565.1 hypothetical protein [Lentimicrobium sp. S6]NPD86344.1 hypothetical protein [Lentimicrobium sp. L6]
MKKKLLVFVSFLMLTQIGFSGGLVHNTNQSTAWTRMMMRNASTDIDAVFYNPAALTKFGDGFHFSINNQSIWQTQTIENKFPHLNNSSYEGTISAPVFPGVYAAWKKGKVAVSVGFNPVGGGGGATFDKGVPLMEVPFSSLVPALQPLGVTGYNMDMRFQGSSIYWGVQAGISYEINENISVFAGARYIIAKNTYEGYIKNVTVTTPSGDAAPGAYVQGVSDQAAGGAVMANGAAEGMQPIIDGGGGTFTLAQLEGAGMITAAQRAQLEGGLSAAGVPQEQIDAMNAGQVQGAYYQAGAELSATSQMLAGQAAYLGVITADQEADIVQKGSGITPILGVNISLMEDKLNFGVKYEFQTNMDLTNEVNDNKGFVMGMDPTTGEKEYMFVDGDKVNADIPAMLSIGAQYEIIDPLRVQLGLITYFDKGAGWAKDDADLSLIDKNFMEYGLGLEYDITEKLLASAGLLLTRTGVNQDYQSNLSFSLSTNTFGGGFAYKINDKFTAQLGAYYVSYLEQTYDETYVLDAENIVNYTETYDKETFGVSIGIDISL